MTSFHLSAVSLSLFLYVVLAAAYYGWGGVTARLMRLRSSGPRSFSFRIWVGWASTLFMIQLIHLVRPLTATVVVPLFVVGLGLVVPDVIRVFRSSGDRPSKTTLLVFAGICTIAVLGSSWIASRSMLEPTNYDSALYHFNSIRWLNSFAIVPGLGNLHGRLAFNQSFFSYVAALNFFPFFNHGRSIANSFLMLLTIATCLDHLTLALRNPAAVSKVHPFRCLPALLVLPVTGFLALSSNGLASPSPDLTMTLLQLTLFVILATALGERIDGRRDQARDAFLLCTLAATAITVKLSGLAFSGVVIAIVIAWAWKGSRRKRLRVARLLAPAGGILLIWCVRGFVLAGAPLYPSTLGYVPVEWAVPREAVLIEARWIASWSRQPGAHWSEVLGNWNWFGSWFERLASNTMEVVYPLVLSLAVLVAIIVGRRAYRMRLEAIEWALLAPTLTGLMYWFFVAPDPRFAHALFFLLPISMSSLFLAILRGLLEPRKFLAIAMICVTFGSLNFVAWASSRVREVRVSSSGWIPIGQTRLVSKETSSGLAVFVPESGDRCWDAPLPCTPYFNEDLRLREPGTFQRGFMVAADGSDRVIQRVATPGEDGADR